MNKKVLLAILAMFFTMNCTIQAQEDIDVDEDDIIVTDGDGEEEVIEFPEAMTYDLDSLLNLYMSIAAVLGNGREIQTEGHRQQKNNISKVFHRNFNCHL